ncbi:MAG: hypothetical protein LBG78_05910 [Azoarcus sp.]|nr:hypothetical protein [Azoarcus sp.]
MTFVIFTVFLPAKFFLLAIAVGAGLHAFALALTEPVHFADAAEANSAPDRAKASATVAANKKRGFMSTPQC